jgi:hypothetical protein
MHYILILIIILDFWVIIITIHYCQLNNYSYFSSHKIKICLNVRNGVELHIYINNSTPYIYTSIYIYILYIHTYIYIHTHSHTHTHVYKAVLNFLQLLTYLARFEVVTAVLMKILFF